MAIDGDAPGSEGPRRHRDVSPWLPRLEPPAERAADDATDAELLDAVEMLHRTRAALDLERATVLAALWSGTDTIVQVGREHYEVPPALRRYLQIRDERCRFPGCNRNADLCDIDHTIPWFWEGETNADNLAHLCRVHHRLKERGWSVVTDDDGVTHWGPRREGPAASRSDGAGSVGETSPFGRKRITLPAVALAA